MLRYLHVRNLAVLAEASLELRPGLNVVTGETGAGKSLVVDSLQLLAGSRASSGLLRAGADLCSVTGIFDPVPPRCRQLLETAGVDAGSEELVIRRELMASGRNRVFVNDQPVTLKLLADLAPQLLRVHGQRDELDLLLPELQRAWLDAVGGRKGRELLARCAHAYQEHRELAQRLERLQGDERARLERIDLLRYQGSELQAAHVVAGEEDELRRRRAVLQHAEAIQGALARALGALDEDEASAVARCGFALRELRGLAALHPEAGGWHDELHELQSRLVDLAATLRDALLGSEAEPGALDLLEDRLALLERLFRKYGATSQLLLEHAQQVADELAELTCDESQRAELEQRAAAALAAYAEVAGELSRARARWGKQLARQVVDELSELALGSARFAVRVEPRAAAQSPLLVSGRPVELTAEGHDLVTFEFQPNLGEELRPLAKVASGGELSRVYLALQLAARGKEGGADLAALVFDEIDAGIGGQEAAAVGRKLRRLASGGQVLVVTHLAQVASFGDHHFRVWKRVAGDRTATSVEALAHQRRVEEVARMLAGEAVTQLSLEHAEELLAGAAG